MNLTTKALLFVASGLLLTFTAVPSVFIADENQYISYALAVRHGELHLRGTEGLPPALGLGYFEATNPTPRPVPERLTNPIRFRVAPLHAIVAAPLTALGWYALVALNAFAFCAAIVLVYLFAKRWSQSPTTPWLAALAFGIGSYALEYAQGVWPHMLSLALVLGSFYLAALYRDEGRRRAALFAGLLASAAFGMRNQSLLFLPLIGAGILLFSHRGARWRGALLYALGALPLILLYSLINHAAAGSWLPLARGMSYFQAAGGGQGQPIALEWLLALWTKVVDFRHHPETTSLTLSFMVKEPITGATVIAGAIKKAWLQSAPWAGVALVGSILAWRGRRWSAPANRELRALSLLLLPVIVAIALKGFAYGDGLSFNQRYLLDLTPLAAIALALCVDGLAPLNRAFTWALIGGAAAFAAIWLLLPRHLLLDAAMRLPLLLAALALFGWFLAARKRAPALLPALLGCCIAWAAVAHVADDVSASRRIRSRNLAMQRALEPALGDGSAVYAFWGIKDPFGALQLDRDLLVVDSSRDEAETLRRLSSALLERGRRVYVIPWMPSDRLHAMVEGFQIEEVGSFPVEGFDEPVGLLELSPQAARPLRKESSL